MHRILIVDDERSVADNLEFIIPWEELGVDAVYKAYSCDEALELLGKHTVDVVITDIRMPGMDGLELIRRIRLTSRSTKCIVLSGYAEFEFAKQALKIQADDYLLKPVGDDELMASVRKALERQRIEWEEHHSIQRMTQVMKENLPVLKRDLLKDLLSGKRIPAQALAEKLKMYEIPIAPGDDISLLIVRLEEGFAQYDPYDLALMEFALCNIVEEIFRDAFDLWHGKDAHEDLAFIVRWSGKAAAAEAEAGRGMRWTLARLAEQLQKNVKTYLKGNISVIVSRPGRFPDQLSAIYQTCLSSIRRKTAGDRGFFITADEPAETHEIHSLSRLYEPPTFINLIEAGRFEEVGEKLQSVFREWDAQDFEHEEQILEVFHTITAAFSYFAHQHGSLLADIIRAEDYAYFAGTARFRSAEALLNWSLRVLGQLVDNVRREMKDSHVSIVRQVNQFIERHLHDGISVPLIADQVYLHPAYLSRVYKLETGESISDYVYRTRMERALYLLKHSDDKIYEISAKLGYQNDSYFIKVFKKQYGVTPQEYRDQ